jgi:hypothetical protein
MQTCTAAALEVTLLDLREPGTVDRLAAFRHRLGPTRLISPA